METIGCADISQEFFFRLSKKSREYMFRNSQMFGIHLNDHHQTISFFKKKPNDDQIDQEYVDKFSIGNVKINFCTVTFHASAEQLQEILKFHKKYHIVKIKCIKIMISNSIQNKEISKILGQIKFEELCFASNDNSWQRNTLDDNQYEAIQEVLISMFIQDLQRISFEYLDFGSKDFFSIPFSVNEVVIKIINQNNLTTISKFLEDVQAVSLIIEQPMTMMHKMLDQFTDELQCAQLQLLRLDFSGSQQFNDHQKQFFSKVRWANVDNHTTVVHFSNRQTPQTFYPILEFLSQTIKNLHVHLPYLSSDNTIKEGEMKDNQNVGRNEKSVTTVLTINDSNGQEKNPNHAFTKLSAIFPQVKTLNICSLSDQFYQPIQGDIEYFGNLKTLHLQGIYGVNIPNVINILSSITGQLVTFTITLHSHEYDQLRDLIGCVVSKQPLLKRLSVCAVSKLNQVSSIFKLKGDIIDKSYIATYFEMIGQLQNLDELRFIPSFRFYDENPDETLPLILEYLRNLKKLKVLILGEQKYIKIHDKIVNKTKTDDFHY